jgi:hypothetical protein
VAGAFFVRNVLDPRGGHHPADLVSRIAHPAPMEIDDFLAGLVVMPLA